MVLAVVGLTLTASVAAHAQSRKAFNTLRLLKQVDGAGSGLDADTVRGVTPDQIANSVLATVAATVITNYVALNQVTIGVGFCSCVHVPCTTSQDAVISCGGGFVPFNAAAHILSSLLGASQSVFVENGKLVLGTWQAIYFCEFDGPRSRTVLLRVMAG